MKMADNIKEIPWPQISGCVQNIATDQFNADLIQLLTDHLFAEQCMVFTYEKTQQMRCLMSINFQDETLARPLAGNYIKEGYKNDPNLKHLKKKSATKNLTIRLSKFIDLFSKEYKEKYYNQPQIIDKVSHIQNVGDLTYYINFYRGPETGPITNTDLLGNDGFVQLLSNIMIQHFEKTTTLRSHMPLSFLSNRERQVCEGILKGKKQRMSPTR